MKLNKGVNRQGAGRPPAPPMLKKESIHLKLPHWLIMWLDEQPESRAVLIENALKGSHGIDPSRNYRRTDMKDVFQATYYEFKDDVVLFETEGMAAKFISNSGAKSCFPVAGFCAGFFDNGETDIDKRWRQYLEAVKFGKKIVIMMRTLDGARECIKPMTKKEHDEFCAN